MKRAVATALGYVSEAKRAKKATTPAARPRAASRALKITAVSDEAVSRTRETELTITVSIDEAAWRKEFDKPPKPGRLDTPEDIAYHEASQREEVEEMIAGLTAGDFEIDRDGEIICDARYLRGWIKTGLVRLKAVDRYGNEVSNMGYVDGWEVVGEVGNIREPKQSFRRW